MFEGRLRRDWTCRNLGRICHFRTGRVFRCSVIVGSERARIVDGSCATLCKQTSTVSLLFCVDARKVIPESTVVEAVAKQFCHGREVYFPRTRTALARVVRSISTITGVDRRLPISVGG